MELFLVCPKCAHLFGSTSARLIEQSGRVDCPSCNNSFDGYAHYRFDVVDEPVRVMLGELIKEKSLPDQRHRLDSSRPNKFKRAIEIKEVVLPDATEQEVRSNVNANLYEAVFSPLPVLKSRWWYANIMFFLIFISMVTLGFNRQIYANNTQIGQWALSVCDSLGCEAGAPRRIDDLRLIGTDLTVRPDFGESFYHFRATIQNVGKQRLQFPAVELKLTDAQGRIVTSRVIYPSEYVAEVTQVGIEAKGEQQLNLMLLIDGAPPVAFDSYLFYPKKNGLKLREVFSVYARVD
ncbi:MAG TPA: hypothetical protein DEO41_08740 [Betaproteobacteria bacterium]|jgi:hypothetical protein|nr:DUF3426 domain-containing protein [Burkholderiales bacterium]HBZ19472.1 hypothetical protein [Betaproteobacteria bacterium]